MSGGLGSLNAKVLAELQTRWRVPRMRHEHWEHRLYTVARGTSLRSATAVGWAEEGLAQLRKSKDRRRDEMAGPIDEPKERAQVLNKRSAVARLRDCKSQVDDGG